MLDARKHETGGKFVILPIDIHLIYGIIHIQANATERMYLEAKRRRTMPTCKDVLETVIENGRVDSDSDGGFNRESLIIEIEFEAEEQGIDPKECVEFALEHTRNARH